MPVTTCPRTWAIAEPGFQLGVLDFSTGTRIVLAFPIVAHWADISDPRVWSALVLVSGCVLVELSSEDYGEQAPRRAYLIEPGGPVYPEGVCTGQEGV
jgi:hypothetical protein